MNRIMVATFFVIITIMILTGCASNVGPLDVVDVKIPVATRSEAPAELLEPIATPENMFFPPTDPAATSCLTAKTEPKFTGFMALLKSRLDGLQNWGTITP